MANGIKLLGFSFNIAAQIQVSGKPIQQNIINSFDFAAALVTLPRLQGESNADYKQRVMDVSVHPGGPSYLGVVNNLTRDLGLPRDKAIQITLKANSAGDAIALNPRVDMLSDRIVLYSNWKPDGTATIDKEIDIYSPDDAGYFLEDLVTEINSSTCFSSTIYSGIRMNLHSTNLIRKTSDYTISDDPLRADIMTNLTGTIIVQGSLSFNEPKIFKTEVLIAPAAEGEYQIDYTNGRVYTYSNPSGNYGVTYHTALFPLDVDFSLVKIYTLQDDDFTSKLFNVETLDSGDKERALPNTEGSEILHQLFKETEIFWGK